jgi:uncharacterized protein
MIDESIIIFIKKHHVLTLATCSDNKPWCANCFYAYSEKENLFVFTTDDTTRHGVEALKNPSVSASIVLETEIVGKIRGLQIEGTMFKPDDELYEKMKRRYIKRFPYTAVMKTNIWVIRPDYMKYTDNRLGFGKKLIWEAETEK